MPSILQGHWSLDGAQQPKSPQDVRKKRSRMTENTILIAAMSGRALAASAQRAGLAPLVVDAFGDSDTRDLALDLRILPSAMTTGFQKRSLLKALAELTEAAPSPPIGLLLGAGFEDRPDLIDRVAQTYRLLGCDGTAVRKAKHPTDLAYVLLRHGIATPDVTTWRLREKDRSRWLRKRRGGTGGGHITLAAAGDKASNNYYYQRLVTGHQISLLVIANPSQNSCQTVGFSEQWCHSTVDQPFRYGGSVGPIRLATEFVLDMEEAAKFVTTHLNLVGLVAVDYVISGTTPYFIEINPRPSATLDLFDTADGALLKSHIAACCGEPTPPFALQQKRACAAAYLYANHGAVTIGDIDWPSWVADRPVTGCTIPANHPIATVFADAPAPDAAKTLCQTHLGQLHDVVYPDKNMEA